MCDTLCAIGRDGTWFAKSSDRPVHEAQVLEVHERHPPSPGLRRTQYLALDDPGAAAVLGSRPEWLWGFEHGVNEHGVAIGNEEVWTVDDPGAAPAALIGMDLVRLGLERARRADDALEVVTSLLDRYGQGGACTEEEPPESYWSSFLVADGTGAWVLETSGRRWAARAVDDAAAISNRITLGSDWDRASPDVPAGADVDAWRRADFPTDVADHRLAATRRCLATGAPAPGARTLAAVLRHHGDRPWGRPGDDPADVSPPPPAGLPDGRAFTVCMHARGYRATAASMIAWLPGPGRGAPRAWVSLGSPCVSVFVPVFPWAGVPAGLGDVAAWRRAERRREAAEQAGAEGLEHLAALRGVLGPIEAELWDEADALAAGAPGPDVLRAWSEGAWRRVEDALDAAARAEWGPAESGR